MNAEIRSDLVALVTKYPAVLSISSAASLIAAMRGLVVADVHRALDEIIDTGQGDVRFTSGWRLALSEDALPASHLPPIPLAAPDGRVFAYACAHCLEVGSIPGIHCDDPDDAREARAKASLRDAACCGECPDCHAFRPDHVSGEGHVTCAACLAALKARQPKGSNAPCKACESNGTVSAFIEGVKVRVQCPDCDGDGYVWQAEAV